jgi:hypothetical protein
MWYSDDRKYAVVMDHTTGWAVLKRRVSLSTRKWMPTGASRFLYEKGHTIASVRRAARDWAEAEERRSTWTRELS